MVLFYNVRGSKGRVGYISFQAIPLCVLFDFVFTDNYINVLAYFKKLIVPTLVYRVFCYLAACIGTPFSRLCASFLARSSEYPIISLPL